MSAQLPQPPEPSAASAILQLNHSADATPPKPSDCCAGCGTGQAVCDESCIRRLAAIRCTAACGKSHGGKPTSTAAKVFPATTQANPNDLAANTNNTTATESCQKGCCGKAAKTKPQLTVSVLTTDAKVASPEAEEISEKANCEKGCCDKPVPTAAPDEPVSVTPAPIELRGPVASADKKGGCQKGCCDPKGKAEAAPTGEQPSVAAALPAEPVEKADGCQKGCCGKPSIPETAATASSRPSNLGIPIEQKPKGGCCGGGRPCQSSSKQPVNPVTKTCGTSDTNKDRGYGSGTAIPTSSELETADDPGSVMEACNDHLETAFAEYASFLEKGLCICSSVLDQLNANCGQVPPRPRPRPVAVSTNVYLSTGATPELTRRQPAGSSCAKSCCGPPKNPTDRPISSCGSDNLEISRSTPMKSSSLRIKECDPEKAAARQRVFLRVVGMTCTGCSRKAINVLNNVDGLSSPNVTFVTGVAEFELDPAITTLKQVIPRIEKETGFKFSPIVSDHDALDILVPPSAARFVHKQLEGLVESIEKVDKTTYRISYDPSTTGARYLMELIEPQGATLAPPGNDAAMVDGRRRMVSMLWSTVLAAIFTIPVVVLNWSDNHVPYLIRSVVSLILATFVQALAVPEFYVGAIKSLIYSRVLEMDMLVVISITAAYGYSIIAFSLTHAGYSLETPEFFETSSLLITLVLLGRLIAAGAKIKAVSAVSLRSLQAEKALLVVPSGTTETDCRLLQMGDSFVVPPHTRIVTDGIVTEGMSAVDESMITGENVPVPKAIGDKVVAGTLNSSSPLTIRMTRLPGKNSITDITKLVENALAAKPRVQDLADKVASYFIPVVITIASVVFGIWIAISLKVRGTNGGGAVGTAISYGIAVLAVSCPCALGLAVPMVLVIAGGTAARSGVIIKQADVIERGYRVTDVVFDKTGTITKGDLVVTHQQLSPRLQTSDTLALAKSVIKDNQHPVSVALTAHLESQVSACTSLPLRDIQSIPGAGIQCTWNGGLVKAGNPYWLGVEDREEVSPLINEGMTLFCVTLDYELVAVFGLKASIREEASEVIESLKRRKIECHIVSGDGPQVVQDVATTVGIPVANVASRHSPTQKQEYVKHLMSSGKRVLFCGDGVNDAVAVAEANVGVQIGTTSNVVTAIADVVLLGGLDGLLVVLDISRRSTRRIIFNFAWSAIYNIFAILLAAGAFVKVRIPPAYAGLGEIVSVLPVIIAALTLLKTKRSVY